jgi:hypothetical protein
VQTSNQSDNKFHSQSYILHTHLNQGNLSIRIMSSRDIKTKTMRARAVNALTSTIVADAACTGTHWLYKEEDLKSALGDKIATPEFLDPPSCGYYGPTTHTGHYGVGALSPYGEETLALLNYMTNEKDAAMTSGENFAQAYHKWAKDFDGYKFSTLKSFEANMDKFAANETVTKVFPECGVGEGTHPQNNSAWRVPVVLCRYLHHLTECLAKVEETVRVDVGDTLGVDYAVSYAKMLLAACGGASLSEAVQAGKADAPEHIVKDIDRAVADTTKTGEGEESDAKMHEHAAVLSAELYKEGMPEFMKAILAKNCFFPGTFILSLKIVLDAQAVREAQEKPEEFDTLAWAIRRNIMCGGDSCGRVAVVAGLLASTGVAMPVEWVKKTTQLDEVEKMAHVLLDAAEATEPKEASAEEGEPTEPLAEPEPTAEPEPSDH